MPRQQKPIGFDETAVESAESNIAKAHNQAKEVLDDAPRKVNLEEDVEVTLPGGATRRLSHILELIDHDYIPEDCQSVYSNPHTYIKDIKPGYMYAWPSTKEPGTKAKIRSGLYRVVTIDEILDDTSASIEMKPFAGVDAVMIGDVVLVEISPRGVSKLYHNREAEAVLRTSRNQSFRALQDTVRNASGGLVDATLEKRILPE